jgi:xanthine phosphoribosyltransferase
VTTNLAQHRSSPKRLQVNIHPTLLTSLLVIPIGLFSLPESAVKKIPHQACALALQLLRQTDMMTRVTGPLGLCLWSRVESMTEQRIKSFPVSWEELHRTSKALAWRLLELGPFDGLIAVTRGGLVPAAIVARELEIRLIDTACISSYAGNERGKLDVLKPSPLAGDGSGWLIVDDLVDTGETAKALKLMMPKAHLATVYAKPAGRPLVDTFVTEVSQDTWIFFPWDLEPQPSTPIIGQR